jgi:hypothetical protein
VSLVEEDGGAGELNAGEENLGELVVARGDGSELFELVEEPSMRLRSQERAKSHGRGVFRLDLGGMTGVIAQSVEGADEGVGVERLVGDQSAGIDGFDERFGASEIVILAPAEPHLDPSSTTPRSSR